MSSPYIDLSGTRLTAMWMGDPAGGLDILLDLLIDDDSIENEHHYSLCGIEYPAKWQSVFDSIDPFEPRLCVSCAARGALFMQVEQGKGKGD